MTTTATLGTAPMTERERHVLDFARAFLRDNDQMPTNAAIASAFGFASPNAANEIMLSLERKGYLARNELSRLMFARHAVGTWVLA